MARAESASASTRSDSIKGLAQAVAKPAYRRLLTAEPVLRRAVPVLIVAFLVTLGIAAIIDIRERHRQAVTKSADDLELIATVIAERIEHGADQAPDALTRAFRSFEDLEWAKATAAGRLILLTDASSTIVATQPPMNGMLGRKLNAAIGRDPNTPAVTRQNGVDDVMLLD